MAERMGTGRLEAFSDGVIAIIVTIMVLELRPPAEATLPALLKLLPVFASYGMSFLVVAIMWVNHHHMIHTVREVDGRLLWLNVNLLFWMSLIPFVTHWIGESHGEPLAVAAYGADLTMCGLGFTLLRGELARQHRGLAELSAYHSKIQRKNLTTVALYASSAGFAFVSVYVSYAIFVLIPVLYFMPEKKLAAHGA